MWDFVNNVMSFLKGAPSSYEHGFEDITDRYGMSSHLQYGHSTGAEATARHSLEQLREMHEGMHLMVPKRHRTTFMGPPPPSSMSNYSS